MDKKSNLHHFQRAFSCQQTQEWGVKLLNIFVHKRKKKNFHVMFGLSWTRVLNKNIDIKYQTELNFATKNTQLGKISILLSLRSRFFLCIYILLDIVIGEFSYIHKIQRN